MQEPTYDRSAQEVEWDDEIPFDGSPLPAPAPRTGPGAFRPGDNVWSVASARRRNRRRFGVMEINPDGSLHLYAMNHGHVYRANPRRWVRCIRNEEMAR
jgi:hypothetical protein